MAALSELVDRFLLHERGAANILPPESVIAQARAAVEFYAGFAELESAPETGQPITTAVDMSLSEWAVIRPLFLLYVERESALQMEATRSMGAEVFGRNSSEVGSDISLIEADMPRRVFCSPIITV